MQLAVYGTLRKGLHNHVLLGNSRYVGKVLLQGELYDLGGVPALRKGRAPVVAECYDIDDTTLRAVDRLEGFDENNPDGSLYTRERVVAQKLNNGNPIETSVYFFNSAGRGIKRIHEVCYRDYLARQAAFSASGARSGRQWIVCFGSNMSSSRLSARVGRLKAGIPGVIRDHDLAFNKRALNSDEVYANLLESSSGATLGVAYPLTLEQVTTLDSYEGYPRHYLRTVIEFSPNGSNEGQTVSAYIAHPDKVGDGTPSPQYLAHIDAGWNEYWGIPFPAHLLERRED